MSPSPAPNAAGTLSATMRPGAVNATSARSKTPPFSPTTVRVPGNSPRTITRRAHACHADPQPEYGQGQRGHHQQALPPSRPAGRWSDEFVRRVFCGMPPSAFALPVFCPYMSQNSHHPVAPTQAEDHAPGDVIDRHWHDDHQLIYVSTGVLA